MIVTLLPEICPWDAVLNVNPKASGTTQRYRRVKQPLPVTRVAPACGHHDERRSKVQTRPRKQFSRGERRQTGKGYLTVTINMAIPIISLASHSNKHTCRCQQVNQDIEA